MALFQFVIPAKASIQLRTHMDSCLCGNVNMASIGIKTVPFRKGQLLTRSFSASTKRLFSNSDARRATEAHKF